MSKKINNKNNKIVREMKECFLSLHLPVENAKEGEPYDFKTKIDNTSTYAEILAEYRPNFNCVNINFNFGVMKSGNSDDVKKLMNMMNGITPFCQFSLCPCCNEINLHGSLFVSDNKLQKDKFNWLLRYMLEIAHLAYPGIGMIIILGVTPEKPFSIYRDNIRHITHQGKGLNEEMKTKVSKELESVFTDLKITINDENRKEYGFVLPFDHSDDPDLTTYMTVSLDAKERTLVILASSSYTVPDEKMITILDLVNRINRLCGYHHLFVDDESKISAFIYGIRLDNGLLPKEEFLHAFQMMLKDALCWFPILQELATSGGIPTDLIRKCVPCYDDRITMY